MGRIFFKYLFIKLFCGRTADVFSVKRPVGLRKIGHDLINTTDYTQIDGKKVLFISLDYKLNVVFEILLCVFGCLEFDSKLYYTKQIATETTAVFY
jgi:hypothetical protein